jgi:enterochelin esterase-like enzyme
MRSGRNIVWWLLVTVLALSLGLVVWRVCQRSGTVLPVEYESKTVGGTRRMLVYLPPDYPNDAPYPVLYLLHGGGDDETSWHKRGNVNSVLDELYARKLLTPMIVVMPNGFVPATAGANFEEDLLHDIIPHMDAHYPTRPEPGSRAIAGLSLGGGQALVTGLKRPETFAWIGAFAPSLLGKDPAELVENLPNGRLKGLLWLSCGDSDNLLGMNESLHLALEKRQVPHTWHIGAGGHEWYVWQDDLRRFAQQLFRPTPSDPAGD